MFKVTKNSCLEKSCGVLPWVVCVACVRVIRASAGGMGGVLALVVWVVCQCG